MKLQDRVAQLYSTSSSIPCCTESFKLFQQGKSDFLDLCIDGEWVSIPPPVRDYPNYSHTLSPWVFSVHIPHLYKNLYGDQAPYADINTRRIYVGNNGKIKNKEFTLKQP